METKIVRAYGKDSFNDPIHDMQIKRRVLLPNDVEIDILYCGICHSDLHAAKNEWGFTTFPIVPGHEIVGRISGIGDTTNKI